MAVPCDGPTWAESTKSAMKLASAAPATTAMAKFGPIHTSTRRAV